MVFHGDGKHKQRALILARQQLANFVGHRQIADVGPGARGITKRRLGDEFIKTERREDLLALIKTAGVGMHGHRAVAGLFQPAHQLRQRLTGKRPIGLEPMHTLRLRA